MGKKLVEGINVDDPFVFTGGTQAFYEGAELAGDLLSDSSGELLAKAGDFNAMRGDFIKLQANTFKTLFGPEPGQTPTVDETRVSTGMLNIILCNF